MGFGGQELGQKAEIISAMFGNLLSKYNQGSLEMGRLAGIVAEGIQSQTFFYF
jgi:hypothetical protein